MDVGADVHERIAALARELHGSPRDEAAVVSEVVKHAVQEIPGAEYAGITLTHHGHRVETLTSTHEIPQILDDIQQRHMEGPCLSATWLNDAVLLDDMETDPRWPNYCRDALRETPIRAVLSFRLFTSDTTLGALNVYSRCKHAFDGAAEEIGYVLATHAALAWDSVRLGDQFRSALASRDVIGQAKGVIMERFNVDAVAAFDLLKRLSQDTNVPLAQIARRLIASGRG
ncbi:MAG: GAF and ANTAR domain-containing protein [Mycobacterium sp.]|uniref:GAF and ANTAR domain-containing protein n=1 Tax=Mycobacterium sp. TaxID=1785 RepID=UPI001EBE899C|nr:GAF and ANTAR domain-containing protein [Mycobacterium sp.]MBW0019920.1 GAF and ANTAR domain-containing protein [Mycobacterium sp.]